MGYKANSKPVWLILKEEGRKEGEGRREEERGGEGEEEAEEEEVVVVIWQIKGGRSACTDKLT